MVLCSCSEGLPYQMVASCPVSTLSCSPRREEGEWRWTHRWQRQRRQTKRSRAARDPPKRAEENQAVNQGSVQCYFLSTRLSIHSHTGDFVISTNTFILHHSISLWHLNLFYFVKKMLIYLLCLQKSAENDKDGTNSTMEDGPGEGFTVLAAKSLFLGQKVLIWLCT